MDGDRNEAVPDSLRSPTLSNLDNWPNAEYGGPERSQSAKHIQINPVAILRHRVTL